VAGSPGRPKAPSPLRSAGALQKLRQFGRGLAIREGSGLRPDGSERFGWMLPRRGAGKSAGHAPQAFCPGGTRDNGPAIHRWGCPPANARKFRDERAVRQGFCRPWRGLDWLVVGVVASVETLRYSRMSLRDKASEMDARHFFFQTRPGPTAIREEPNELDNR